MERKFMIGFKKLLFVMAAVVTALVGVAPKTAEAATVKMSQTKITVMAGERFTLNVKGAGKKTVTWSSSNAKVATVTKRGGNVVTKKKGTATIKATVGKKTVKCKVTVKAPASKPYLTATKKTLHVGESFLLIQGQYTNYESTFSFNDRVATVDCAGRVVATGVGTTKILVNRGQDAKGNYIDYFCTVTVVAGKATKCNHQWMDTLTYNTNGVVNGSALDLKNYRDEFHYECNICGEKFLTQSEENAHAETCNHFSCSTSGGGKGVSCRKFTGDHYCSKCGAVKD